MAGARQQDQKKIFNPHAPLRKIVMPSPDKGKAKKTKSESISIPKKEMDSIKAEAERQGFENVEAYLLSIHRKFIGNYKIAKTCLNDITKRESSERKPKRVFKTRYGKIICGDSRDYLNQNVKSESVDLIVTSPPFGLVRKKVYGNEDADIYVSWFEQFGAEFIRVLKPSGSLVIDIGGAWKSGFPTRSLYHYELLIMLCRKFGFHLAQDFFWWNPAKLPTPAEWVNIRRVRVKDAVNCIWWLSKTPYPKVSNKRILQPYSKSMKDLLKNGYKPKLRPSGHNISNKFQQDNKGAIPPNLIALANTESNSSYLRYCRKNDLPEHPARFPAGIPAMFMRFLTNKNDVVIDPFAGSCMTGYVAEQMQRIWTCCELDQVYIDGAMGRFTQEDTELSTDFSQTMRRDPYPIYPPQSILDDDEAPLVIDGGRRRPVSKRK